MAYVAVTTNGLSKAHRVEGHTSNVENPIYYTQFGTLVVGTITAGDTFIIPHFMQVVNHINLTPINGAGATILYGAGGTVATEPSYVDKNGYVINWEVLGAASTAGALTLTLGSSASAVNSIYNGCIIDVELANGVRQSLVVTGYVGATKVATCANWPSYNPTDGVVGLISAVTTGTYYRVRGSVVTCPSAGTTPQFSVEVIGLV